MLQLKLKQLMTDRGITDHGLFLSKAGFTYHSIHRLLNNKGEHLSFKHAEKLCLLLNCTPDDLLTWHKPADTLISEDHALQKLQPKETEKTISEHLKELPLDKLEVVKNYIKEIQKG